MMRCEIERIAQMVGENGEIATAMRRHERVAHFAFIAEDDDSSEPPLLLKDVTRAFKMELRGKGLQELKNVLEQTLALATVSRVYLGLTFRTKEGVRLRVDGYGESGHGAANFIFSDDRRVRKAASECHFDSERLFQNAVLNGDLSSKIFDAPKAEVGMA